MDERSYEEYIAALTFEKFVAQTFDSLVDSRIGTVKRNTRLTGKRTGHSHQIDVLIELSVAELRLLVVVECKHYKAKVGIDDVLEFAQRLDDIGAHKGVLVTTLGFQEGAIKVADAHRIALVTTEPVWRVTMFFRNRTGKPDAWVENVSIGGSRPDGLAGITMRAVNAVSGSLAQGLEDIEADPRTVWLLLGRWMRAR